jgi:hypothetical protein
MSESGNESAIENGLKVKGVDEWTSNKKATVSLTRRRTTEYPNGIHELLFWCLACKYTQIKLKKFDDSKKSHVFNSHKMYY